MVLTNDEKGIIEMIILKNQNLIRQPEYKNKQESVDEMQIAIHGTEEEKKAIIIYEVQGLIIPKLKQNKSMLQNKLILIDQDIIKQQAYADENKK